MATMITVSKNGKEVAINADSIKWLEQHPSAKGTRIYFITGDYVDVEDTADAVYGKIKPPT